MSSMTEEIVVETDPGTGFRIFTDEFDRWWGRGPIDARRQSFDRYAAHVVVAFVTGG